MGEAAFVFQVSDDGSRLLALWQPGPAAPNVDEASVQAALVAQGLDDFFIEKHGITEWLDVARPADAPFEWPLGERRDGTCAVAISDDKMEARLTLTRAYRGVAVTDAQIREALAKANVTAGVLDAAIADALAAGSATGVVVAAGRAVVHGTDSAFVSLIHNALDRRPKVDEHGVTDYRDLGRIPGVTTGDPVMRRTPATTGTDGFDVKGTVLKAKPGKSTAYAAKLKGVVADPNDPELLVSAIVGRPVQVANGMTVEPTIDFAQVDMSTGNIDFDGSVTVAGDVMARMRIKATGDVLVHGTVSSADIEAGGQVVLLGGFKGALDEEDDAGHAAAHESKIRCRGAFHARFIEYADVQAGADILIDDHSMFSTLISARHVVVGEAGAKGQILGGTITAVGQVTATKYGGPSGAKTLVQVGLDPKQRAHLEHLDAEIAKLGPGGLAVPELERLKAEAESLRMQLALSEHSCVTVGRAVFPGTEIRIWGKRWSSFDEHASGVFRVVNGEVELCAQ